MFSIIPNWHPFIVHFTIALLTTATLAMLVSLVLKRESIAVQIRALAHWNLWLGGLFAVLAGISGLFAFNSVQHDDASHLAMLDHRAWALATIATFIITVVVSLRSLRTQLRASPFLMVLCIAGLTLLMSTGWRGSELVYRHGLGVLSLPNPAKHDHAAGAGHDHSAASAEHDDHDEHAHQHDPDDEHPDHVDEHENTPIKTETPESKTHVHADGQVHQH